MIRKNSAWETDLTVVPVKAVFIAVRFLFIFRNIYWTIYWQVEVLFTSSF